MADDDSNALHFAPTESTAFLTNRSKLASKSDLAIIIFGSFLGSAGFSIVLPSMWPFIKSVHGTKSIIGWAIAAESIGTFLASTPFGWWSDRRPVKEVMIISLLIGILGDLLYAFSINPWMIIAARLLVGISGANYTVTSSYISYATTEDQRVLFYSLNSGAGVLGFILGPVLAALTTFPQLQFRFSIYGQTFYVNDTTYPGYVSAVFMFANVLMYIFKFKEVKRERPSSVMHPSINSISTSSASSQISSDISQSQFSDASRQGYRIATVKISMLAVLVMCYFNFSFTTLFTSFETICTPYSIEAYNWDTRYTSMMWAFLGIIAIVVVVLLQFVKFGERISLLIAEVCMTAGTAVLVTFTGFVSLPRFIVGTILATIGYGVTEVLTLSIYSKLLEGSFEKGTYMGHMNTAGSLARVISPVYAGYVFEFSANGIVLIAPCVLCGLAFVLNVLFYRKLARNS